MVRYYSTLRPVIPGCVPKKPGKSRIKNFGAKVYCSEIGREAWGYIEYELPLTEEEADACRLMPGEMKTFYCVTTSVSDSGRIIAAVTDVIDALSQPEGGSRRIDGKATIYRDWYVNREEAEKMVGDAILLIGGNAYE